MITAINFGSLIHTSQAKLLIAPNPEYYQPKPVEPIKNYQPKTIEKD